MRPAPNVGTDNEVATKFPKHFVTKHEAIRILDRTDHTLYRWTREGLVRKRKRAGVFVWEVSELMRAKADNLKRGRAGKFQPGHVHAGPGRPKHPARPEIARLLAEGHCVSEIVEKIGCSNALVKTVRREMQGPKPERHTPQIAQPPSGWVKADEALRIVGLVNKGRLKRWHDNGFLQRRRCGKFYYFDPAELMPAKLKAQQRLKENQFRPGQNKR